ncbi:MAG TPA: GNAT family N-acetyltransferase [Ohtaekwangia sp.]
MEYVIRKVERGELPVLVDMCERHAQYEQAAYDSTCKQAGLEALLFGENPRLFCYVVVSGQKLVGYFTYTFDTSTWDAGIYLHVDCLYLEPDYRGFRIGDEVMNMVLGIARANDCVTIQWQTPDFNKKAIRFYNRIGATGNNKMRFCMHV